MLKLPEGVQALVHSGEVSTGHARALLQAGDVREMARLATAVVNQGLSVRELEALVRGDREPRRRARARGRGPRSRQVEPDVRRVEDALRRRLKTDVFLTTRGKGSGRLTINFYSSDDLARLLEMLLGEPFSG